ncbi:hypothetical protein [Streptacidiphilus melanogenes]|uniref:hypothetical protein n=1 Tax=Streptacidiphilus melanogenes TaxID=411235 RepID=UPI0005A6F13F|nr:hypothetical protein [Streptacidiphilus melanogenes]
MARLTVDDDALVLVPGLRDRLATRVGKLRVPLACVVKAEVLAEPWRCLRGRREHGLDVPDVAWKGVWRHPGGRDLILVRPEHGPCVQVDLRAPADFARIAVTVSDPQAVVERLRSALGAWEVRQAAARHAA